MPEMFIGVLFVLAFFCEWAYVAMKRSYKSSNRSNK